MTARTEDLLRELAPQVLGAVVRRYGDFDAAEDAVREALLAAAMHWPTEGLPDNPRGWLIQTAVRRLTDQYRSDQARRRREEAAALREVPGAEPVQQDDALVLLFLCCHPALTPASSIALTLRTVAGLSTTEIAKAFLVPEATMAQRISRAKQKLKASGIPFRMPASQDQEFEARLRSVLPSRTGHDGTGRRSPKVCGSPPPRCPAAWSASTSCRPGSPPCTTAPSVPRTPTGRRSSACTACWCACPATRWWS